MENKINEHSLNYRLLRIWKSILLHDQRIYFQVTRNTPL